MAFGIGTVPMMMALSLAGGKIHGTVRLKFQRILPFCLVLVAFLLILRGMSLGIPYISPDLSGSAGQTSCH